MADDTDVVAVLDSDLTQVFEIARPIKATVKEEAKAMEHPLETGATVVDHRVIQPIEIELSLILTGDEYTDAYEEIRELFNRAELLTVQTRTGSYPNMMIIALPHDETPEMADAVALALHLRETNFVQAQFSDLKVSKPADGNTKKRGAQQPQTATTEKKGSILSGIFR